MDISYPAIIAAAVSTLIGGIWYAPLMLHKAWANRGSFAIAFMVMGAPMGGWR